MTLTPWPEHVEPSGDFYPVSTGPLTVEKYVRVTKVAKMIALWPERLQGWYEKQGQLATLEAVRLNWLWFKDLELDQFLVEIESKVKKAKRSLTEMNKAADIGTTAHRLAENWLRAEAGLEEKHKGVARIPESVRAFTAFQGKWAEEKLEVVRTEQFICSHRDKVGGTIDIVARCPRRGLGIVDLKTSKYLVADQHVQVAAYFKYAKQHEDIQWAELWRMPKEAGDSGPEVKQLGHYYDMGRDKHVEKLPEELFAAFFSALQLYRIFHA
jgi:hypothetical protein